MFLGSPDDRRHGHLLPTPLPEPVPDIAVVIASPGNVRVPDKLFLESQFPEDVLFDLRGELAGTVLPLIGHGKTLRIGPVNFEDLEEPGAPDLERSEDVLELDLLPDIALEKRLDLLVAERFVKMSGHDVTSLMIRGLNHSPASQSTSNL